MEAGDSDWWLTARNKISSDFDKSQFPIQWQPRNTNIPTFSILCDSVLSFDSCIFPGIIIDQLDFIINERYS